MNTPQDFSNLPELTAAPGFAERLRQATALAGYGDERGWQQRIADELGVKNQAIGQWMRGETLPSSTMMLKISRRFGVTLDWLLLNRGRTLSHQELATALCDNTVMAQVIDLPDAALMEWINTLTYQLTAARNIEYLRHRYGSGTLDAFTQNSREVTA